MTATAGETRVAVFVPLPLLGFFLSQALAFLAGFFVLVLPPLTFLLSLAPLAPLASLPDPFAGLVAFFFAAAFFGLAFFFFLVDAGTHLAAMS